MIFDALKYACAAIAEERSIKAIHKQSGDEYTFKNRTELWGGWKNKDGGWLAEVNAKRLTPMMPDEFEIIDIQTPLDVKFALKAAKTAIYSVVDKLGTSDYYGYIGKGDSWRVGYSTILKYKGNREGMLRPLYLNEVTEYLIKKHEGQLVHWIEADDQVVIDCYKNPNLIAVIEDKDFYGCSIRVFNPYKMSKPETIKGFGYLKIGADKKVHGRGRLWFYHQVMSGDAIDNYKANSASDVKWGEKSSYQQLADCSNDKEAMQALVDGYKILYPEKKIITGWRGDSIEIDWKYVLQENFNLAKMMRTEDEKPTNIDDVLSKLGIRI